MIGAATSSTTTPVWRNTRYSRHATDALPAYVMPTQPKLPNISRHVGHAPRLSDGTAVSRTVVVKK